MTKFSCAECGAHWDSAEHASQICPFCGTAGHGA